MVCAIGIRWEIAPRIYEWDADRPSVSTRIKNVNLVGRIGRDSAATNHIHLVVEIKPSRLTSSSRYQRDCADRVSYRIEAERIGRIHYRATLEVRCSR